MSGLAAMDMLLTCSLLMSFEPAASFLREYTGGYMFHGKYTFFIAIKSYTGIVHSLHVLSISMWFVHVTRYFCLLIGQEKAGALFLRLSIFWCLGLQSEPNTHGIQECQPGMGPSIPQDLNIYVRGLHLCKVCADFPKCQPYIFFFYFACSVM